MMTSGHKYNNNRIKQILFLVFVRPCYWRNINTFSSSAFITSSTTGARTTTRHLSSFVSTFSTPALSLTPTALSSIQYDDRIKGPITNNNNRIRTYHYSTTTTTLLLAKPKSAGNVVDNYQTVSVNCNKCKLRLFRYKKKNGTKSNLIKCYIERICEDSASILEDQQETDPEQQLWNCPKCNTNFARSSQIHGRPALKLIGGKIRMTKK
jgi:hypothetical protein